MAPRRPLLRLRDKPERQRGNSLQCAALSFACATSPSASEGSLGTAPPSPSLALQACGGSSRVEYILLSLSLREDRLDQPGLVDVGQPFVPAVVAIRQLCVVEAHQVQHGRVQIGDLGAVVDRAVAEIVGGPVGLTAADAGPGEPDTEAVRMMVATVAP